MSCPNGSYRRAVVDFYPLYRPVEKPRMKEYGGRNSRKYRLTFSCIRNFRYESSCILMAMSRTGGEDLHRSKVVERRFCTGSA
jgi:hypothetical protein